MVRCPDILSSHNEYIRSPQRTFENIWDPRECRKHSPTARIFYISLVFSNARRVLSQSNTRHRRLYLLSRIRIRSLELLLLKLAERKLRGYHRHKNENLLHFSISFNINTLTYHLLAPWKDLNSPFKNVELISRGRLLTVEIINFPKKYFILKNKTRIPNNEQTLLINSNSIYFPSVIKRKKGIVLRTS